MFFSKNCSKYFSCVLFFSKTFLNTTCCSKLVSIFQHFVSTQKCMSVFKNFFSKKHFSQTWFSTFVSQLVAKNLVFHIVFAQTLVSQLCFTTCCQKHCVSQIVCPNFGLTTFCCPNCCPNFCPNFCSKITKTCQKLAQNLGQNWPNILAKTLCEISHKLFCQH